MNDDMDFDRRRGHRLAGPLRVPGYDRRHFSGPEVPAPPPVVEDEGPTAADAAGAAARAAAEERQRRGRRSTILAGRAQATTLGGGRTVLGGPGAPARPQPMPSPVA